MKIYLTNKSSVISTQDFSLIIKGLNIYFQQLTKDWGISPVVILNSMQPLTSNLPNTVIIFDSIDDQNSSSYNFETDPNSISRIFAKTILDSDGCIFYKDDETMSVSQFICGEILGSLSNLNMNKWYMDSNMSLWWGDISSPVKGNIVKIQIQNTDIAFSDYVLPSYFGPPTATGPFNKLNTLMGTFAIDQYGYSIKYENNNFTSLFGENCPQETMDQVSLYLEEFKSRFTRI